MEQNAIITTGNNVRSLTSLRTALKHAQLSFPEETVHALHNAWKVLSNEQLDRMFSFVLSCIGKDEATMERAFSQIDQDSALALYLLFVKMQEGR